MANTLPNGTILNNKYEIISKIAEGGFGIVYQARDVQSNRICAVKENLDNTPPAQQQFEREAKMLQGLRHPSLPEYYAYFQEPNGQQYFAMEFVEGEDLDSKVKSANGPLPEIQVLTWITQVCDALNYIHTQPQPIIHRDIKPENIRITPRGKAMLVDFGIAKTYDPKRRTTIGARGYTQGYSPLEQYSGTGSTDARSDVYALGATLYRALTGVVPPESVSRPAGTHMTKPRQINPGLSAYGEAIILKAMELNQSARYQTIKEMWSEISAILTGIPVKITGTISRIGQAAPIRANYAQQKYNFFLHDDTTRKWINCTFEGSMRPLTVLNDIRVIAEGILRGGNQLQVEKLTDATTGESWKPKTTSDLLDRFLSAVGL